MTSKKKNITKNLVTISDEEVQILGGNTKKISIFKDFLRKLPRYARIDENKRRLIVNKVKSSTDENLSTINEESLTDENKKLLDTAENLKRFSEIVKNKNISNIILDSESIDKIIKYIINSKKSEDDNKTFNSFTLSIYNDQNDRDNSKSKLVIPIDEIEEKENYLLEDDDEHIDDDILLGLLNSLNLSYFNGDYIKLNDKINKMKKEEINIVYDYVCENINKEKNDNDDKIKIISDFIINKNYKKDLILEKDKISKEIEYIKQKHNLQKKSNIFEENFLDNAIKKKLLRNIEHKPKELSNIGNINSQQRKCIYLHNNIDWFINKDPEIEKSVLSLNLSQYTGDKNYFLQNYQKEQLSDNWILPNNKWLLEHCNGFHSLLSNCKNQINNKDGIIYGVCIKKKNIDKLECRVFKQDEIDRECNYWKDLLDNTKSKIDIIKSQPPFKLFIPSFFGWYINNDNLKTSDRAIYDEYYGNTNDKKYIAFKNKVIEISKLLKERSRTMLEYYTKSLELWIFFNPEFIGFNYSNFIRKNFIYMENEYILNMPFEDKIMGSNNIQGLLYSTNIFIKDELSYIFKKMVIPTMHIPTLTQYRPDVIIESKCKDNEILLNDKCFSIIEAYSINTERLTNMFGPLLRYKKLKEELKNEQEEEKEEQDEQEEKEEKIIKRSIQRKLKTDNKILRKCASCGKNYDVQQTPRFITIIDGQQKYFCSDQCMIGEKDKNKIPVNIPMLKKEIIDIINNIHIDNKLTLQKTYERITKQISPDDLDTIWNTIKYSPKLQETDFENINFEQNVNKILLCLLDIIELKIEEIVNKKQNQKKQKQNDDDIYNELLELDMYEKKLKNIYKIPNKFDALILLYQEEFFINNIVISDRQYKKLEGKSTNELINEIIIIITKDLHTNNIQQLQETYKNIIGLVPNNNMSILQLWNVIKYSASLKLHDFDTRTLDKNVKKIFKKTLHILDNKILDLDNNDELTYDVEKNHLENIKNDISSILEENKNKPRTALITLYQTAFFKDEIRSHDKLNPRSTKRKIPVYKGEKQPQLTSEIMERIEFIERVETVLKSVKSIKDSKTLFNKLSQNELPINTLIELCTSLNSTIGVLENDENDVIRDLLNQLNNYKNKKNKTSNDVVNFNKKLNEIIFIKKAIEHFVN